MIALLYTRELTCANAMPLIFAPPSFWFCAVVFRNGVKKKLTEAQKNEGLFLSAGAHSCTNSTTFFCASVNFFLHRCDSQQHTKIDGANKLRSVRLWQKPYLAQRHFCLHRCVSQRLCKKFDGGANNEGIVFAHTGAHMCKKNRVLNCAASVHFSFTPLN
jgi:hypothetical protein